MKLQPLFCLVDQNVASITRGLWDKEKIRDNFLESEANLFL